MKIFPATAAALALIASSPSLAQHSKAFETSPTDPLAVHGADIMVGGYLDSLESLVDKDQAKAAALIQDLRAQWLRTALPDSLKSDLVASSEHLLQRLSEARFERADLDLLRLEVVDARVSFGLTSMTQAAASNKWDEEKLHSAVMDWLGTTSIFGDAPDPRGYRARLTASLELAMLQATGTVAASHSLTVEMLRLRLATAIRRYQLAFEQGHLTAADFDRLVRIAIIRVRRILEEKY